MSTEKKAIKYLTFGSPLMDMIVDVDSDFVNRNNLKLDTTIHGNSESGVFREARLYNPKYIAGGCSYNAIRVLNWMLPSDERNSVACLGSVGEDEDGVRYRNLLNEESIIPLFETFKGKETGKCAVVCLNRERTHITDLGASTLISDEFVEENWETIKTLSLVYTELYILSSRASIVYKLANLCLDEDKTFGFNFPSAFFLAKFSEEILDVISYGDVIFANKEEAKFFVTEILNKEFDHESDLPIILSQLPKKNINKKRVVVVTCGPEPAHIAVFNHLNNKVEYTGSYEIIHVSKDKIVDTNGAGDSFAGGFLASYMRGASYEHCMKSGHWAAQRIIKERGFDVPIKEEPYDFTKEEETQS
jgi:adenosine kinase